MNPGRVKLLVLSAEYPDPTLDGDEQKREFRHRVHGIIQEMLETHGHFQNMAAG